MQVYFYNIFIFDLYYPQRYYQDILQNEITFVERPYGIGPHDIMSQGGTYYPHNAPVHLMEMMTCCFERIDHSFIGNHESCFKRILSRIKVIIFIFLTMMIIVIDIMRVL